VVQQGREGVVSFAEMRRSAYALVALTSTTRRSGLDPSTTRIATQTDIDYIDIFDFFNVPKMMEAPPRQMGAFGTATSSVEAVGGMGQAIGLNGAINPEADWLGY